MELPTKYRRGAMAHGGDWARVGPRQRQPFAVNRLHLIAVAHPDDGFHGNAGKNGVRVLDVAVGPAKFAADAWTHLPAKGLASELHPIADAENGNAEIENRRIALRRVGGIDAGRAAREDQAGRLHLRHARGRQVVTHELAEDILFAPPPGDQLAVLRAEVEDQDAFILRRRRHGMLSVRAPSVKTNTLAVSRSRAGE